jgi:hypothetical protein
VLVLDGEVLSHQDAQTSLGAVRGVLADPELV